MLGTGQGTGGILRPWQPCSIAHVPLGTKLCPHLGSGSRRVVLTGPCEGEAQGLFFQVCLRKTELGQHELSTDVPGVPRARFLKAADHTLACVPRGWAWGDAAGWDEALQHGPAWSL